MKNKITNGFVTSGYISPDYFCNRDKETRRLLNAVSSRRNITLISLRRMGKTGLLKHVKYYLEHDSNPATVIYSDLLPTMNSNEMLNSVSSALVRLKKGERNFFEKVLGILASLRPRLTLDSLTGEPSIEIIAESASEIQHGLDQVLRLISEIDQDIVFMFDEFQQIGNYPEKNIEQMLRTIVQAYPSIPFIFSGSSRHMLENMFLSASRPFYQSSELMYLGRIDEKEYRKFITRQFLRENKNIDDDSVTQILLWTRQHTYYIQYICSLLYEKEEKNIAIDSVNKVFLQVLTDFEPQYISYRNLLPAHQFRLLQALAAEDGVTQPTSGKFILNHHLTSPSSVATSLKALSEKEMIINEDGKWMVYDVFFSRWLEYNYKR